MAPDSPLVHPSVIVPDSLTAMTVNLLRECLGSKVRTESRVVSTKTACATIQTLDTLALPVSLRLEASKRAKVGVYVHPPALRTVLYGFLQNGCSALHSVDAAA